MMLVANVTSTVVIHANELVQTIPNAAGRQARSSLKSSFRVEKAQDLYGRMRLLGNASISDPGNLGKPFSNVTHDLSNQLIVEKKMKAMSIGYEIIDKV